MSARRAVAGFPFSKAEKEFFSELKAKFKYTSDVWIKSREIKDFSKVLVKPNEKAHLYSAEERWKIRYFVYNTDQLFNGHLVVEASKKMQSKAWAACTLKVRKGKEIQRDHHEINEECDAFIKKLQAM